MQVAQYQNLDMSLMKILFNTCPDNVNIDGYYQTEKYFKHTEENIRKDFTFKDDILSACKEYMDQYDDISFLHIRRGDNVGREDYYPTANYKVDG